MIKSLVSSVTPSHAPARKSKSKRKKKPEIQYKRERFVPKLKQRMMLSELYSMGRCMICDKLFSQDENLNLFEKGTRKGVCCDGCYRNIHTDAIVTDCDDDDNDNNFIRLTKLKKGDFIRKRNMKNNTIWMVASIKEGGIDVIGMGYGSMYPLKQFYDKNIVKTRWRYCSDNEIDEYRKSRIYDMYKRHYGDNL